MRKVQRLNDQWTCEVKGQRFSVTLPHTYNAKDGQDGGNDYYRGTALYSYHLSNPIRTDREQAFLEFKGVNATAKMYVNGKIAATHRGGYSTFFIDITPYLRTENLIEVETDNSPDSSVYPQKADFTFYGGIYRDVNLIIVPSVHFAFPEDGSSGLFLDVSMEGETAHISYRTEVVGDGGEVRFQISEAESGLKIAETTGAHGQIILERPHLWNGTDDPFLYRATAILKSENVEVDRVNLCFGCRSFYFNADKGFFLNGRHYPLHGVSRHQDREGIGNALTPAMHEEDMALIREVGANAIRLAHYQHDAYFYDLCDKYGMIVWAEIPYISEHRPEGNENTISQMTELIGQNRHHPSIVCWGLSNEITVCGYTEDLMENHKQLNDLVHQTDNHRPTAMACAFMLDKDHPLLHIPDIIGFNLYFGWYMGKKEENGIWLDDFHMRNPTTPLGLTEYGADAVLRFQTEDPVKGDYTEQYQAQYHESILRQIADRPYIWGSYCWNMFDFGSDARDEGGVKGRNSKGLVTFDRSTKKDAFFLFKAFWSNEPFIHICGKRFIRRCGNTTKIVVYSNLPSISLEVNGKEFEKINGDKVFTFMVPLTGDLEIKAHAADQCDTLWIQKVLVPDETTEPRLRQIVNWFEKEKLPRPEGYFSLYDTVQDVIRAPGGRSFIEELLHENQNNSIINIVIDDALLAMIKDETFFSLLTRNNNTGLFEDLKRINRQLNNIPRQ